MYQCTTFLSSHRSICIIIKIMVIIRGYWKYDGCWWCKVSIFSTKAHVFDVEAIIRWKYCGGYRRWEEYLAYIFSTEAHVLVIQTILKGILWWIFERKWTSSLHLFHGGPCGGCWGWRRPWRRQRSRGRWRRRSRELKITISEFLTLMIFFWL